MPAGITAEILLSAFITTTLILYQISLFHHWHYPCYAMRLASFMDISFVAIFIAKVLLYNTVLDPMLRKWLFDKVLRPSAMTSVFVMGVLSMVVIWAAFLPVNPCLNM